MYSKQSKLLHLCKAAVCNFSCKCEMTSRYKVTGCSLGTSLWQALCSLLLPTCSKKSSHSVLAPKAPSGLTGTCPLLPAPGLAESGVLLSLCPSSGALPAHVSPSGHNLTCIPRQGRPSLLFLLLLFFLFGLETLIQLLKTNSS